MNQLVDSDSGEWLVVTASGSLYLLDLDLRTLTRGNFDLSVDRRLRRDGEVVALIAVVLCRVGSGMHLVIDLAVQGVDYTTRLSTTVLRIEPLPPDKEQVIGPCGSPAACGRVPR